MDHLILKWNINHINNIVVDLPIPLLIHFSVCDKGRILPKYHAYGIGLQSCGYRNYFIGIYGIDQELDKSGCEAFYALYYAADNHFA